MYISLDFFQIAIFDLQYVIRVIINAKVLMEITVTATTQHMNQPSIVSLIKY